MKNYVLEFAKTVGKLKELKRAGWVKNNIPYAESVADHSYRTAVLGMLMSDTEGINTERVIRMLLLHDLEETVTGDIPNPDKVKMDKEKLSCMQKAAIEKVLLPLPSKIKESYLSLWNEMEEGVTQEAKLCKDVDRLEMMIQAYDYEAKDNCNKEKLESFWKREDNAPYRIKSIVQIYEELKKQRNSR